MAQSVGDLQLKLTDFLRKFLYPCVLLHNILALKKFARGDLRLCALRELDETLSVPGALGAVERYDCVVCIATVREPLADASEVR
jgi:hypothetical protein